LDVGLQVKGLFEKIYTLNAFGFAVDTGISADITHPFVRIRLGLAAANLGPDIGFSSDKFSLPWQLRVGCSLQPLKTVLSNRCLILGDVLHEQSSTRGRFGIEFVPYWDISLRYGIGFGFDTQDHTFGLGYRWESWAIDYAFVPYGMDLGDVHQIGIRYRL
jgi:hypothetical protein